MYWTNSANGAVMSMPVNGGTPATLVQDQSGSGTIVVDADHVYWTDSIGVKRLPIGGGTPVTLAGWETGASAIAVDSTSVYWTDNPPSPEGSVMQLTLK